MKNKKGVQINQMKRDLAQLLETGQDRTARIRVEHVIREEKMVAAYDLVEIYCELIVARMPIIESQKTCPIDLKEAVTSVIFAAPRCSDISELADIKKQFTAKYGKEFVSAALELRPESGVSRMLVEKLSAVAPDVQSKVKVLTAVAKEHNINWEPTLFEEKESKPPNDLLNGPTNFENASMANIDPPKIQPSSSNQVHTHEKKRDPPLDFAEQNRKYVVDNGVGTSSSGITSERMETRDDGQNWNMGFKDATSAAEAAAESAERAAMAARAAAQFASHEKIPTGSIGEDNSKASYGSLSGDRKSKIPNQQKYQSEHEQKDNERFHEDNTRSSKSNLFKESKTVLESGKNESFSGDRKPMTMKQQTDQNEHEQKETERFHDVSTKSSRMTSFIETKTELESDKKEGFESENINLFAEETIKKQPSIHCSSSGDDEVVSDDRDVGKRSVVGNPFAVVDKRNIFSESIRTESDVDDRRDDEAVFDDDGGPKFDTGFEYDEVDAHIWSPKRNESIKVEHTSSQAHVFSESHSFGQHSMKSMESVPASFDHSDGPDSESESEFNGNKKSTSNVHDVFSTNPEPSRKSRIELNDLVEGESSSVYDHEVEEKKQPSRQSSSILPKKHELKTESYDTLEDDNKDSFYQSNDSDTGIELKFDTLTGGLRNKGGVLRFPPYTKNSATDTSILSKKSIKESFMADKKPSVSVSSSESDSDDHSDEFPKPAFNPKQRILSPVTFFDDEEGPASDKKISKQVSSLRPELSRRTRGSPSVPRVDPEPKTVISSFSKPSWKSHSDEIPAQRRSYARKTEESDSGIEVEEKPRVNHSVKTTKKEAVEMMTEPPRNSDKLGKIETVKTENVVKKPSYVHPKLPDYDTFAARLQSLRDEHK